MRYKEFVDIAALGVFVDGVSYIYDRHSNMILRVDNIIYDILDDIPNLSQEEIIEKYKKTYDCDDIKKALEEVYDYQDKDVFVDFAIPEFRVSEKGSASDFLSDKLNNYLTQLAINVSEDCNLRCKYCVYSGSYENRRSHNDNNNISYEMALKAIDFFLDRSKKSKDRYLSLYGGEPFLRRSFVESIVEYAKNKDDDINIAITTNGTMLDDSIIAFLARYNISLTISLDGPRELNDRYRTGQNGELFFDKIMNTITMIKEKYHDYYQQKVKINSVVAPFAGEIEDLDDFFNDKIFSFKNDNTQYSVGMINPNKNSFIESMDYQEYVKRYFSFMFRKYIDMHVNHDMSDESVVAKAAIEKNIKMLFIRPIKPLDQYAYYWPNGICLPGVRSLFVSSKGEFYPCEKLYDYGDMIIGDLEKGFDGNKIKEYIDEYCDKSISACSKCWAYRLCGECFLSIRGENKWDLKYRNDYCLGQKNMWVSFIVAYIKIITNNQNAFNYFDK
ncbi:radical SAM protein [Prosthecochloris sp. SCSIO W1101]|uniref:radical SAM/SPASM domain-containing protein n=1 Tax=Prosthecochloris sp. SCSIO W1101 TaxID=2992242 RepID=UPI00223E4F32|nr:radical SAM protein [Prosthecochloris sp. SCSIO W1101]UZJ42609.1 radical SAM protein [Prosthecochloris sp. SCSIO W1101]